VSVHPAGLGQDIGVLAPLRGKRVVLVGVLMAAVAGYFWFGSRYPALNEKAAMGAETPFSGLAFSTIVDVPYDASVAWQILYATINWTYTNRQGMTFGVLFGALVMTLLALFRRRSFQNRYANAAMGMAIGTPLGVCVNCAAPIAQAIHAGGGRAETMLAAMLSSPTLNAIVVTMLLALFPFYMAAIKIGLTLGVILIGIPLLTRLSRPSGAVATPAGPDGWRPAPSGETWLQATGSVGRSFGANLWFIVRTTVPLMLLAGLLGSIVVTLLPLESLADFLSTIGPRRTLVGMCGVALIGLFLPVPMTFDVIVTAVLWQAGLPVQYAMVLLFTLGVFSIYPFFIVWRSVGRTVAVSLFLSLAGLGVVAGFAGQQYFDWDARRQEAVFFDAFRHSSASLRGPHVLRMGGDSRQEKPDRELVSALRGAGLVPQSWLAARQDGISVERIPFGPPLGGAALGGDAGRLFTRFEGPRLGLDEPSTFSVLRFEGPFAQFRGIASGDVHNDGWMDLLLTSPTGLALYANQQGKGFVLQQIDIPELKEFYVTSAALVDLDNDGWLDIVFSTYRHGNYVIYNRQGRFTRAEMRQLPRLGTAMVTAAMGFGDVDRDGKLDIVLGDWVPPCWGWYLCDDHPSNNFLLRSDKGWFRVEESFRDLPGRQTLNILLSDINDDGKLDLIIGNEDRAPDIYYLGNGDGTFRQITRGDGLIPHTTGSTMSVASGDVDNDLRPEIYLGQITHIPAKQRSKTRDTDPAACDEISDPRYRKGCQETFRVHLHMPSQTRNRDVYTCSSGDMRDYHEDCVAYSLFLRARAQGPASLCDLLSDRWDVLRFNCRHSYAERASPPVRGTISSQTVPVNNQRNVLLSPVGNDRFVDKAVEMGVQTAGFTWNAKFADVDNDEFVDLFAVNGWFPGKGLESHFFYHNEQGKRFSDQTEKAGLRSFLPTSAYTYVDLFNTGNMDIVAVPIVGPVLVYVNNSTQTRIAFELRDEVGNRFGIGSKVIIHYGAGGARHQLREIQASGGFISFDAPVAYFGLGGFQRVERVEVRWSTGERSEITGDFQAGARYIVHRHSR
jgi:uncharacterized membrane protein YraQ (UPF0718 family)